MLKLMVVITASISKKSVSLASMTCTWHKPFCLWLSELTFPWRPHGINHFLSKFNENKNDLINNTSQAYTVTNDLQITYYEEQKGLESLNYFFIERRAGESREKSACQTNKTTECMCSVIKYWDFSF